MTDTQKNNARQAISAAAFAAVGWCASTKREGLAAAAFVVGLVALLTVK